MRSLQTAKAPRSNADGSDEMYSGVQLCNDLKPKQRCFRLRKYNEGTFDDIFHEHVPDRRISAGNAREMMKALVLRYEEAHAERILRSYLNSRRGSPAACNPFQITVEYPEPGVMRTYCGTNVQAWMDEVIAPGKFRPS